ncbi:DUF6691 family protein [Lacibacterium aquatile]|uniref:DUF6691 family protein n=1 Tax=Lacibacterium aquatile TaxID=1168082 RepID=A0ABW5DSW2_9PROT
MKLLLSALVCGALFGSGLVISDMINPARVLGFLDLTGDWDPAMLVVMGAALIPSFLAYKLKAGLPTPLFDPRFHLPTRKNINGRLVFGAILFGIGWGLIGLCPGPALAALTTGRWDVAVFVLAMVAGFAIYRRTSDTP